MVSLQQNRRRRWNRFCLEIGWGEAWTMYTHVSKCKNDKIKKIEKKDISGILQETKAGRLKTKSLSSHK
jgi:hypothetical protein